MLASAPQLVELTRDELVAYDGAGWLGAVAGAYLGLGVARSTVTAVATVATALGFTLTAPAAATIVAVCIVAGAVAGYYGTRW